MSELCHFCPKKSISTFILLLCESVIVITVVVVVAQSVLAVAIIGRRARLIFLTSQWNRFGVPDWKCNGLLHLL